MNPCRFFLLLLFLSSLSCGLEQTKNQADPKLSPSKSQIKHTLSLEQANRLAALPLECMQTEFPNKLGQVIASAEELGNPKELHPAFYGCFDWHSAVHGHWSLVYLLKKYPTLNNRNEVIEKLLENISSENINKEVEYFAPKHNSSYERTYGWAWLLKLAAELHTWDDPTARILEENLQPLTDLIAQKYMEFLPKLVYPIRVGEHSNTAFGLGFAYDYAEIVGNNDLMESIRTRAIHYYKKDQNCPLSWEPSGFDFLSPCFEEIDLMRRVLTESEFKNWLSAFMPDLLDKDFDLEVGKVSDREDGKLVHLDGLNFSRAWVIYGLCNQYPEYSHLSSVADAHVAHSLPSLVGDSYEGGHWLGSFAIYALQQQLNEK